MRSLGALELVLQVPSSAVFLLKLSAYNALFSACEMLCVVAPSPPWFFLPLFFSKNRGSYNANGNIVRFLAGRNAKTRGSYHTNATVRFVTGRNANTRGSFFTHFFWKIVEFLDISILVSCEIASSHGDQHLIFVLGSSSPLIRLSPLEWHNCVIEPQCFKMSRLSSSSSWILSLLSFFLLSWHALSCCCDHHYYYYHFYY